MIHLRIYDMNYHFFYKDFKSYSFPSDSRYDNIFRYLKKYKDTKREVCLVICDSYILSCMDLMVEQKITSKFDKIIDKWANKNLFYKKNNKWLPKFEIE